MAVTAVQVQQLIVLECGDAPDGRLAANIGTLWALHADKGPVWPRLQEWYVRRHCLELLLGYERGRVDTTMDGLAVKYQQRVQNLREQHAAADAEIASLLARARSARAPQVGQLTQTNPDGNPDLLVVPATFNPDENAAVYRGSPYFIPSLEQRG